MSNIPTPLVHGTDGPARFGFFGRSGGLSSGLYRSLNCGHGSADEQQAVAGNRARVASWFGQTAEQLCSVHQIHSARCVIATPGDKPEADAMVTNTPGIICSVLTADCVPVLFADPSAQVVGAAHAGWKGALGGVLETTIDKMCALGARKATITAHIGPAIRQMSYEVSDDFAAPILAADPAAESLFIPAPRQGHLMFDLPGWCARRLQQAGLRDIIDCRIDTYRDEDQLFSYRRACHRDEPDYGRNISAIMLTGD